MAYSCICKGCGNKLEFNDFNEPKVGKFFCCPECGQSYKMNAFRKIESKSNDFGNSPTGVKIVDIITRLIR